MKPNWKTKYAGLKVITTSDGCSGVPDFNFQVCCDEHDFYYRNEEVITGVNRWEADLKMVKCVFRKWKLPIIPLVYWIGVRLFGWRYYRGSTKLNKVKKGKA